MSTLKTHEKVVFEKLFDRGGYVLDFTDPTFSAFFREHQISIDDPKYKFNGASKMKRLRAFWEVESDVVVGKVLEALLQYAEATEGVGDSDKKKAEEIVDRLVGKPRAKLTSSRWNTRNQIWDGLKLMVRFSKSLNNASAKYTNP